jgi:DNA-binding NarL/FixJ family response regulator
MKHEASPGERLMSDLRPQVLIADDHAIFAEALRLLLEKSYRVVGTVADGRALLSATTRLAPDVIVVDIGMPLLNGLDAAQRIRERMPKVKLVFLTMQDDPNLAAAAMEMGAAAFVLKHSAGSELLTAIEQVLHGGSYLTPKLRSDDWVTMKQRAKQFSKELTPRQREIVQLWAEGHSLKQIGAELNLSEKTVEFHKHHIMEVYNLKSNADLVLFALKQGLILLDAPIQKSKSPKTT